MKRNTSIYIIVSAIAAILVLTACSGVIGGETSVRIAVDELSGAKYISPSANSGYVIVMEKDKVFSLGKMDGMTQYTFENGYIYITNIPPGDYVFGVALMDDNGTDDEDDDDNYGLAIKEVTIKKGFNNVYINVTPGIDTFTIGGLDFSDFFAPEGFTARFATDTIYIGGTSYTPAQITLTFQATAGATVLANTFSNGRQYQITDPDTVLHNLFIILE